MATLEILEKPDVRVFQEFGPEAPSLIRPLLEAVVIGPAYQVVEKGAAGEYFGALVSYPYPGLIVGADVVTAETEVFLQQGTDEYDITTGFGVVVGPLTVDLPALLLPEKDIVPQRQIAATFAGTILIDEEADFVTAGVRPGDILNFVLLAPSLIEPDSVVSAQGGDFIVLNVNSPTELEITPTLLDETKVEYTIKRVGTSTGDVKISFRALRGDLVGQLIEVQSQEDLEAQLGVPHPVKNPLSYGVFLALLHTDSVVAATAIENDTLAEWATSAEFLESKEIYGMSPLTQRPDVHQMFQQHVNQMSEPSNKRERIVFINPEIKDKVVYQAESLTGSTLLGSDIFTDANAEFQENGVPIGAILKFATPQSFGGSPVTEIPIKAVISETQVQVVAAADATVAAITYTVESRPYTLLQKALNMKGIGEGYRDRRVIMIVPDKVLVSENGGEVEVPGYYLGSAEAGLVSGTSPSQGFTNFPFAGFLGLRNSNFTFNETQLGVMAAGGAHIFIQETLGGPITVRHQLTTDVTSIQRRELSIVKTVDFVAKYLRNRIRRLIGINNITDEFLNNILKPQTNGIIEDMVEDRILGRETKITKLIQHPEQKDRVLVDITMDMLFPANFIDYTLII
jgi:hypothetical protein